MKTILCLGWRTSIRSLWIAALCLISVARAQDGTYTDLYAEMVEGATIQPGTYAATPSPDNPSTETRTAVLNLDGGRTVIAEYVYDISGGTSDPSPNLFGAAGGKLVWSTLVDAKSLLVRFAPGFGPPQFPSGSTPGGVSVTTTRKIAGDLHVVNFSQALTLSQGKLVINSLPLDASGAVTAVEFNGIAVGARPAKPRPRTATQWHLDKIGLTGANGAWALYGNGVPPAEYDKTLVAVLSTGVRRTLLDLAANMWVNLKEYNGGAGDNDSNGLEDDIYGADVKDGDVDPDDTEGKGTHLAGLIGATGQVCTGVVKTVRMWPIRVVANDNGVTFVDILQALAYIDQTNTTTTMTGGQVRIAVACHQYASTLWSPEMYLAMYKPSTDQTSTTGNSPQGRRGTWFANNCIVRLTPNAQNTVEMAKFVPGTVVILDPAGANIQRIALDYQLITLPDGTPEHRLLLNRSHTSGSGASDKAITFPKYRFSLTQGTGTMHVAQTSDKSRHTDAVPVYPACMAGKNVISVSGSDQNDGLMSSYPFYADYGRLSVDIFAPSVDIVSSSFTSPDFYKQLTGTETGAALVAGAVAFYRGLHPDETVVQVYNKLITSAELRADPNNPFYYKCFSQGRLNVLNFLQ